MNILINTRNTLIRATYKAILKPIFFLFDPEVMHKSFIFKGKILGSNPITRGLTSLAFNYKNSALEQNIAGIKFENPIGLAAGFDKNAELIPILSSVGFGFAEVGSITAKPHTGNEGKRLKRIIEKKSIWVHLGLNNNGADYIYNKLKDKKFKIPYGASAAKTNCKETTNPQIGLQDYIYTIKKFDKIADYITINISCPNAFGGQDFANPKLYSSLINSLQKSNLQKPIFIKLSPDTSLKDIDKIIELSKKANITGFIASNLTKKHKFGKGGVSGKMVKPKADFLLQYLYKKTKGKYILIGVGGVSSAKEAYDKIKHGASLIQLITGMIYEGPQVISEINSGLVDLLKADGYSNISEAVGSAYKKR